MDWLRALYSVIGAPFPVASVVLAGLIGALVFGGSWWLVGREYRQAQSNSRPGEVAVDTALTLSSLKASTEQERTTPDASQRSPAPQPSASPTVTQTMIDSPGGVQVAGDLHLGDKRLIQTLTLEVKVSQQTPSAVPGEPETDMGLGSAVAFFTKANERIRFVTDFRIVRQQVTADTRQVTFVYSPETPSQILGREVGFLREVKVLVVNYAEIFQTIGFGSGPGAMAADILVRLNGVVVVDEKGGADRSGILSKGQASFDVAGLFEKVPDVYNRAVSR